MAWAANIISKSISDGSVNVTIEYANDGQNAFMETYRSPNPSVEWVQNTVRGRLASLESATAFNIATGPFVPPAPPAVDPNIQLFRSRCRALEIIKVMIDLGAVTADNAKVVALINWIRNNSTYVDYLG